MVIGRRNYSKLYAYEAHFIFMEVSGGIYKVMKDRPGHYNKGQYITTDAVIAWLNAEGYRVAICQNDILTVIHANFGAKEAEEITNAEMKGLLKEEEE